MKRVYPVAIVLFMVLGITHFGSAFTGPSSSGGIGDGAIAVDSASNIGIGATSTYSLTKLYVKASSTGTTSYAMRVLQSGGTPLFTIRDDGAIAIATTTPSGATSTKLSVNGNTTVTGTLTATTIVGALSGTLSASNVSANVFGAGNFAFPSSLGIATSTQVSLPAALSVYGAGYINQTSDASTLRLISNQSTYLSSSQSVLSLATTNGTSNPTVSYALSATYNGSSIFSVRNDGLLSVSTSGIRFSDGTTQTTAASGLSGGGWTTSGTNVTLSTSTNNVGIGTSSPSTPLEIYRNTGSAYSALRITNGDSSASTGGAIDFYVASTILGGKIEVQNDGASGETMRFYTRTSGAGAATEKLRILNNGNLGIGTATPGAKLEVKGSGTGSVYLGEWGGGSSYGAIGLAGSVSSGNYNFVSSPSNTTLYINRPSGQDIHFREGNAVDSSEILFASGGKVGIGLSPTVKLDIADNTALRLGSAYLSSGSGSNYLHLANSEWFSGSAWTSTADGALMQMSGTTVTFYTHTGTPSPSHTATMTLTSGGNLSVVGTLTVGAGSGKIDVGTVDPPYTINGKPYATYLPSMTGVKEETTGVGTCEISGKTCLVLIDFKNAKEGSDAWLFSKTTNLKNNFDRMTVLATPNFNGSTWYEKDATNLVLKIYANMPEDAKKAEVSYRLTAPRFDAAAWPNAPTSSTSPGFIIED